MPFFPKIIDYPIFLLKILMSISKRNLERSSMKSTGKLSTKKVQEKSRNLSPSRRNEVKRALASLDPSNKQEEEETSSKFYSFLWPILLLFFAFFGIYRQRNTRKK